MLFYQCVCRFQTNAFTAVSTVQADEYKLTERGIVGLKNLGNTVHHLQIISNVFLFWLFYWLKTYNLE